MQNSKQEKPTVMALEMLESAMNRVAAIKTAFDRATLNDSLSQARALISKDRDKISAAIASDTMNHLRRSLELLQEGDTEDQDLVGATQLIAKTLAILYPISKSADRQSSSPLSPVEQSSPDADRREAPRKAIEADIGFQSDTNFFMGFSEDISEGGIFISTYDLLEMGSTLSISFTLPGGHQVTIEGVVRWVREFNEFAQEATPGMGIQFSNVSKNDQDAISRFIAQREPLFYD